MKPESERARKRYAAEPAVAERRRAASRKYTKMHPERRAAYRRAYAAGGIKEVAVENYLKQQVEQRGGFCPKFISPGHHGAPDRIVFLPAHPAYFVELKRPRGGHIAAVQVRYHEKLRALGQSVWILRTIEEVDSFFNEIDHA